MSSEIPRNMDAGAASGSGVLSVEHRKHDSQAASVLGGTRPRDKRIGVSRGIVWFAALALVVAAWPVSKGMVFKAGSGFGYYIGIVGGVMMLLMLLYPLRKHVSWARNWGPLRYWFMLHMIFGIGGPTLVLFHSTFHVKSLNGGIALYSMLLVASSGVIGRFIYRRIHQGLYGRQLSLKELQQSVDAHQSHVSKVSAVLMEAAGAGEKLRQFRKVATAKEGSFLTRAWSFMTLGQNRRKLASLCHHDLRLAVEQLTKTQGWDMQQQAQYLQAASLDVDDYLNAVQQAAQYSAYERMFSLWHILHTPFVWLLGISGIVHVIATQFLY